MIRRILLPLAGLLALPASAVVVDLNLTYDHLRLKDGMVFTEVAVRSYNTSAGTVVLRVNRELVSIQASLLPDEVGAMLKELTPVLSKEEQATEQAQEAAAREQAAENAARRQRVAEEEAQATRAASRELAVKLAEQAAARETDIREEVTQFAESRARAYFKYQDDPNSNIGAVIDSDVFLEHPEPVPGWTGRYRVEGVAYRQYVNNQASGFGRGRKEFEMLIQTSDAKKPELLEIRIK